MAVNHASTFAIKIRSALLRRKAPLDFKARPMEKTGGAVSATVRLTAVGLGQDSLRVMRNHTNEPSSCSWAVRWLELSFGTRRGCSTGANAIVQENTLFP